MYPGQGAPLDLNFPDVRAAIAEIRALVNGTITYHPEGGKPFIRGYSEQIWPLFGRIAKGVWLVVSMFDRSFSEIVDRILWAICGFEIVDVNGSPGLVRYEPLIDALDELERGLTALKAANPHLR